MVPAAVTEVRLVLSAGLDCHTPEPSPSPGGGIVRCWWGRMDSPIHAATDFDIAKLELEDPVLWVRNSPGRRHPT